MRYLMPDNKVVVGETADDIVRGMGDLKFRPARNLARYRRRIAQRVFTGLGEGIPYATSEELLEGMERVGLVERLDG